MRIALKSTLLLTVFLSGAFFAEPACAQNSNNEHKYFIPRSATLFSPRFAGDAVNDIDTALNFNSSSVVWHYPFVGPDFDTSVIDEAKARLTNETINAALPAFTREPEYACKDPNILDSNGNPTPVPHHAAEFGDHDQNPLTEDRWNIYYPDTQNSGFQGEVSTFLDQASLAGVTSLHQDDPAFMVVRESKGCYPRTHYSLAEVEGFVDDYYDFLINEIEAYFGYSVPMTYNMSLGQSNSTSNTYKRLASNFNGVMGEAFVVTPIKDANGNIIGGELDEADNTPENLINAIHEVNNLDLNLTTITTLVSDSPLRNKRHISAVYALGGHTIAPYDVYINHGSDFDDHIDYDESSRYEGSSADFASYFKFVKDNANLFSGFGVRGYYADHHKNTSGVLSSPGNIAGVASRHNVMGVLKGNSEGKRVLHVINWQVQRDNMTDGQHYFTFWVDKSSIPFVPTTAKIHRPGKSPYTTTVFDNGDGRWKVTVGGVDVWGMAEFQ